MDQTPSMPDDLVSLTQAGSLISVTRWTIRRMITNGTLTGYTVGLMPRVSASEVRSLVRMASPAAVDSVSTRLEEIRARLNDESRTATELSDVVEELIDMIGKLRAA